MYTLSMDPYDTG